MDVIDYDTKNIIFNKLSNVEQLCTYKCFDEKKPSQFNVSRELLRGHVLKGDKGLTVRAITTGDLEPCIQLCLLIAKTHMIPSWLIAETNIIENFTDAIRETYENIEESSRITELVKLISKIPLPDE
jgi:hypothetical protein